jgi:hypothetical protein
VSFTLLGLSIFPMAFMFVKGSGARIKEITTRRIGYTRFFKVLGLVLAGGGLLVNEITVARFLSLDGSLDADLIMNLRKLQVLALVGGVALLMSQKALAVAAARVAGLPTATGQAAASPKLLGISLLVPWIVLLSITEADRLQRFWWLSPLQFIILASTVTYIAGQLGFNSVWRWVGSVMLVVAMLPSSLLSSRITAWADHGWSGTLPNRLKAVDSLAQIIKADNRTNAAIGYGLHYQRYVSVFNTMDSRYRVGADYDLFFRLRHGISNLNKCAEGFSSLDEYRIEEAHYIPPAGVQQDRIPMPAGASFRLLKRIDTLSVLKRTDVD